MALYTVLCMMIKTLINRRKTAPKYANLSIYKIISRFSQKSDKSIVTLEGNIKFISKRFYKN